jgi:plastocyanin
MRFPIVRVVAGIVFLVLALIAASARRSYFATAAEEQPPAVTVSIDNFSFTPKEITVAKGTTVTWVNRDDVPHTVVGNAGAFRSKALDTDEKYSFTFSDAGSFSYFCSVHPVMIGKVIVK